MYYHIQENIRDNCCPIKGLSGNGILNGYLGKKLRNTGFWGTKLTGYRIFRTVIYPGYRVTNFETEINGMRDVLSSITSRCLRKEPALLS